MAIAKKLTPEQALVKIKHFCAYQERCHKETKEKLYGYGLYSHEVDKIIVALIEENFLNEERFAQLFAGGKFRNKHWGKKKIQYELQQKGVSKMNIVLALKAIDQNDYLNTATKLIEQKKLTVKGQHHLTQKAKIVAFMLQKGYEQNIIYTLLSNYFK
jgi:regulatory protein